MLRMKYLILVEIISISVVKLSSVCSYLSNISNDINFLTKREDIPDLNEFPPEEEERVEHPSHKNAFGLGLIAPIKKVRSKRACEKKMKLMKDIMRPTKKYNPNSRNRLDVLLKWKMSLVRLCTDMSKRDLIFIGHNHPHSQKKRNVS